MLLTKTPHKLGCIQKDKEIDFTGDPREEFLKWVTAKIYENSSLGIEMTVVDISSVDTVPDYSDIEESDPIFQEFESISLHLRKTKNRIFFYLPQNFFLGSQLPQIVEQTKKLLEKISFFLENLGVSSPSIVLRIGSAYGSRKTTLDRFNQEVIKMPLGIRKFLLVTNDDKPSLFSVTDLLSGVFYKISIPICFRFLPHFFNSGGLSVREALYLSCSTWPNGIKPIFIHSESESVDQYGSPITTIVSSLLSHRIPVFSLDLDVVVEAKNSRVACVKYRSESRSLKPIVINKVQK